MSSTTTLSASSSTKTRRPWLSLSLCAALLFLLSLISSVENVDALAGTMPKARKSKHYAVASGRKKGVYDSWDACKKQVHGFNGAKYKSFPTRPEAVAYIAQHHNGGGSSSASSSSNVFGGGASSSASSSSSTGRPGRADRGAVAARDGAVSVSAARPTVRLASSATGAFPGASSAGARSDRRAAAAAAAAGGSETTVDAAPPNEIRVAAHFDGGARGNPGVAGAGAVVVIADGDAQSIRTTSVRTFCGMKETNNAAEYTGMLEGLKVAREAVKTFVAARKRRRRPNNLGGAPGAAGGGGRWKADVVIKGDSNLIIKQMNGEYAVKSPNLKKYFGECRGIASELMTLGTAAPDGEVRVSFGHVYREGNKVADALANQAMDEKRSWTTVETTSSASTTEQSDSKSSVVDLTDDI